MKYGLWLLLALPKNHTWASYFGVAKMNRIAIQIITVTSRLPFVHIKNLLKTFKNAKGPSIE